jgi:hypothetical protein
MVAKTLTLDCPRGQTGRDNMTTEGPTRMPEALRALQTGKLPRKAGLILDRQGSQYDLTIQAETLSVSGLGLPKAEDVSRDDAKLARVDALRHLTETLDLLFGAYVRRRLSNEWMSELTQIRSWLRAA